MNTMKERRTHIQNRAMEKKKKTHNTLSGVETNAREKCKCGKEKMQGHYTRSKGGAMRHMLSDGSMDIGWGVPDDDARW